MPNPAVPSGGMLNAAVQNRNFLVHTEPAIHHKFQK